MIVDVNGTQLYIDGFLKTNLDRAKSIQKKDWDMVFLYDGYEGSGKSLKAMQDAYYMDPSIDLKRITFSPTEFATAIKNADQYQSVIYDEAYSGLNSRASMTLVNRTLVKMLAEIRQKRLFVAIVMPTFFDLDRYVAIWRSRALIHVYTGENYERGYFSFYNLDRKKLLYVNGKKFYSYAQPLPNFRGRFAGKYVVNEEAYRKKKKDSLMNHQTDEDEELMKEKVHKQMFLNLLEVQGLPHSKKAEILQMPESTYYLWLKKHAEIGEL